MTVAVVGEALVDLIADGDGGYRPHLGGSPFNVAIALARLGTDVSYLSALSVDPFGEQLRAALELEGVVVPLQRRSQHPTSLALTPSQLPGLHAVFDVLAQRGVPVSIDVNIRDGASASVDAYVDGVRALLPRADIVKASDEDLAALGFGDDAQAAARKAFAEMGRGALILTEGSRGATLFHAGGTIVQPAFPVACVADTVGAGDSFHAAFLSRLHAAGTLAGLPANADRAALTDALEFAAAAAAINVSRAGCAPPTAREVADFLAASGAG